MSSDAAPHAMRVENTHDVPTKSSAGAFALSSPGLTGGDVRVEKAADGTLSHGGCLGARAGRVGL